LGELKVQSVDENLKGYKSNWPQHATRMNKKTKPTIMLNYGPRRLGKTSEETINEAETGLFTSRDIPVVFNEQ
jgi:hypothetical protein